MFDDGVGLYEPSVAGAWIDAQREVDAAVDRDAAAGAARRAAINDRFNTHWWRLSIYRWFPFDCHLDVCLVRLRVEIGHYYPSVSAEATVYDRHAHFKLGAFFHAGLGIFWDDLAKWFRVARCRHTAPRQLSPEPSDGGGHS